jgi:ABC-type multidrug transport system ATPase subunit
MQVELQNISKIFQNHAVFKGVNLSLADGYTGVILGGNGSGKSTLLKVISGALTPSSGGVIFSENGTAIPAEAHYQKVAFCGPYTDLIEDFTLIELIQFQQKFRPFLPGIAQTEILSWLNLRRFENRPIKTYSSGMKQRVRLALTIFSDVPLLLLDEPTSNLDPEGKGWYRKLIESFLGQRSAIVASNYFEEEYFFAKNEIALRDFQK